VAGFHPHITGWFCPHADSFTTSALFLVLSDLMNRAWEQRKKAGQNPAETTPT
jgi:hypothetical protein